MTLAIVTHKVGTGAGQGRVNYEVARAALARGHTVLLVASAVDDDLRAHDSVTWLPVSVDSFPTELVRNQVFAWRSARRIRRHRDAIDVLLANGAITWADADVNAAHFVHSAWLQSPAHTVRTQSGPYAWYQGLYTAVNAWWERWAFRQADTVVAVSSQVRRELRDVGVPEPKIQVIPNGVDLDEFSPGPPERKRFDLPEDVPLGVLVGDLKTSRKNLGTVLRAMQRVPAFHLAVAGHVADSPYPALAGRLGVDDRVHFLGFCEDVPALMRSGDVCLCPSLYEPFSLVLLEALASGCPVITAETVGAADLLPDEAGWVLDDATDATALSKRLETVSQANDLSGMRRAARRAAQSHGFRRMGHEYLDVLEATNGTHPPNTSPIKQ